MKIQCLFCVLLIIASLLVMPIYGYTGANQADAGNTVYDKYCFANNNALSISAESGILTEASEGLVLYGKNADKILPMASTTKIMTAYLAIRYGDLNSKITVTSDTVNIEGSSIYLTEGETLTLKELLYGMMLRSGNDAAVTVAKAVSGSVADFVALMNFTAKELGLKNTNFVNPCGLPDDNHYTTAEDLARLTAEALKYPEFESIVSAKQTSIGGNRYLINRNKLLFSYDGMIGVKTGYTPQAGLCLVTAAKRNGVTLISVTLNDGNEWADHKKMLDYGFSVAESRIIEKGSIKVSLTVTGGSAGKINAENLSDSEFALPKSAAITIETEKNRLIYAPIKKGDILCYAYVYANGYLIKIIPLAATEDVDIVRMNFFERFLN